MKTLVILFTVALSLQGCSYAISPGMADKADKTISFEKLQADPDAYAGKLLILGGTITQITTVNQGMLIEVDQKQLDYWGKPERTSRTGGRFIVFHPGYLNTMIYGQGVEITIAGEVLGLRSPMIGDRQYDYPVVLVKELKLWERERGPRNSPQWIDPLYDPDSRNRPE
jgi:outer membrane lipoprotein